MTKKIIKFLAFISTLLIIFCVYLVIFGLETTRFNSLIKKEVKNQNNRLRKMRDVVYSLNKISKQYISLNNVKS